MDSERLGDSQFEGVKANGLISKKVKKDFEEYSSQNGNDLKDLVAEAFNLGMAYYSTSEDTVSEVEESELVNDDFWYLDWQVNSYSRIKEFRPDLEWADIKTAFLSKGLETLKDH